MSNCDVEFETLVDYIEDQAPPIVRARLESHLASGCQKCQDGLAWLGHTVNLMRSDTSIVPPREVVRRARVLFREHGPRRRSLVGQVIAALIFDSGMQPNCQGVRAGSAGVRQLLYCTPEFDVDFLVEEADGTPSDQKPINLSCQILSRGDAGAQFPGYDVTLIRGEDSVFCGRSGPAGEISMDNLTRGIYDVHVSIGQGELIIEGLEI